MKGEKFPDTHFDQYWQQFQGKGYLTTEVKLMKEMRKKYDRAEKLAVVIEIAEDWVMKRLRYSTRQLTALRGICSFYYR